MTIRTVDELIDAFGGPTAVAEWAGTEISAICNWKARGFIPTGWHLRVFIEVKKRGLDVDPRLFEISDEDAKILFGSEVPKGPKGKATAEAVVAVS